MCIRDSIMVDYSFRITFPPIGTLVTVLKINRVYIELILVNYIEIILEAHFYIRCSSRTALCWLGGGASVPNKRNSSLRTYWWNHWSGFYSSRLGLRLTSPRPAGHVVHASVFILFSRIQWFPETKFLGLAELAETSNVCLSVRPSVRPFAPQHQN